MNSFGVPRACVTAVVGVLAVMAMARPAWAQPLGTGFTYQGVLSDGGQPASGVYDLRFRLYTAASGGGQVGATLCADNLSAVGGRFTAVLDFGAQFAGQRRWLEIEVRRDTGLDCGTTTGYTPLTPRQELTPTPNADFALTAASATAATNATQLGGHDGAFYQDAGNLNAGTVADARLAATVARTNTAQTFTGALTLSNAANAITGTFTGNGAAITGLSAANIATGTLADARLSANVALLNGVQTFSGAKTFSAQPAFTAAGVPFSVTSAGLVGNLNADMLDGQHGAFYQDAANLTGSLADARLSANVARLNLSQTFTGQPTFSVQPVFSSAAVPFLVTSAAVVTNLNADLLDGQHGAFYQNAGNLNAGVLPNLRLSGGYTSQLSFTHPSNVLAGDGAGLTGLNAGALATGTVADARLSAVLARTNVVQNFTVQQTFSVEPVFSDPAVPFIVNSANRVPNLNADLLDGQHGAFYQNAANLTGSLSDTRLSANVALLGGVQSFTGAKTFAAAPSFTSAGAPFTVSNTTRVTNLNADLLDGLDSAAFLRSTGSASISGSVAGGATLTSINAAPDYGSVGLMGRASAVGGQGMGVYGIHTSSGAFTPFTVSGAGVIGYSDTSLGVAGATSTGFAAVYGSVTSAAGTGAAFYGVAPATGDAGFFQGRVRTTGSLFVNSDDTGSEGLTFGSTSSGERIGSNRSGAGVNQWGLDFYTGGQPRMAITLSGNVGIGNTAPGMSLEVSGPGTYYGKPSLGVSDGASFLYMMADSGYHPGLVWNAGRSLRFGTETSRGTGYAEKMRITDAGRVGIATSDPSGLFQVGTETITPPYSIIIPGPGTAGMLQADANNLAAQTFTPLTDIDVASVNVVVSSSTNSDKISFLSLEGPGLNVLAGEITLEGIFPQQTVIYTFASPPHLIAGQQYRWRWTAQTADGSPLIWYRTDNPYADGAGTGNGVPANSDFVCSITSTGAPQVTPIGLVVKENHRTGICTLSPSEALTVSGNANITGTLSKGGGSFQIDHPLDPANKFLYHSFVESPDMMNIYNGNTVTGDDGLATIVLPEWFEALNRDFRYQLTVIDEADDADVFLWAKVVREVRDNRFAIRSSRGGVKVSWQVTGIRKDAFAEKNRIPVEVEKGAAEKGLYLHPDAFGQPAERGIYSRPAAGGGASPVR